jgi:hypothetical protein
MEQYRKEWKHATIHLNTETGEMHSDGNHSVRTFIETQIADLKSKLADSQAREASLVAAKLATDHCLHILAKCTADLWHAVADGKYDARSFVGDTVLPMQETLLEIGIDVREKPLETFAPLQALSGTGDVTCEWTFDEMHGKYNTQCESQMEFTYDDIEANGFKFCPYCGRLISQPESEVKDE